MNSTVEERVPWSKRDRIVLIVLAILPFLFFPKAISGDTSIVMGDGIIELPYRIAVARMAFSGELPFWSPDMLGGADIWSYPTAGVLSPLTYLFGIFPTYWTLNILWLLVCSLALVGTYVFARIWGVGRWGSAAAALAYSFSGFFYSYIDFNVHGMTQSAAFLPLLLAAYYRLAIKPSARRAALAACATFFMGAIPQDQVFFYSMVHAGFITFIVALSAPKGFRYKIFMWAAIAVVIGTATLSVRVLPTINLVKYSVREGAAVWLSNAFAPHNVAKWHTLFNPLEDGQRLASLYFGEIPFFLAVIGILSLRRMKRVLFTAGGLALGIAGLLWVHVPSEWTQGLPVLGWFHSPFRHLFEVFFWASILTGFGMDILIKNEAAHRRTVITALAATVTAGLVLVVAFHLTKHYELMDTFKSPSFISFAFFCVVCATAAVLIRRSKGTNGLKPLSWPVILLLLVALVTPRTLIFKHFIRKRIGISKRVENPDRSPMIEFLRKREEQLGIGPPLWRSIYLGSFYNRFYTLADRAAGAPPNTNLALNFPLIQAKNELINKRFEYFMRRGMRHGLFTDTSVFAISSTALDLMNVRYVILSKTSPPVLGVRTQPLYENYITKNHDEIVFVKTGPGIIMRAEIDTGDADRAVIIVSHFKDSLKEGANIAKLTMTDLQGRQIHRIVSVGVEKDGIKPLLKKTDRMNEEGLTGSEDTYFYVIQLPLPEGGGKTVLEINVLDRGAELNVLGGVLIGDNDVILKKIPLVENFLESTFNFRRIYDDPHVLVFERPTAFPRQWLTKQLRVMEPKEILGALSMLGRIQNTRPGPETTAFVEDERLKEFGNLLASAAPDNSAFIQRVDDGPNHILAKVSGRSPVFAVFSEPWAEGWEATLDGKPAHIYITDFYLRGIPVPAGEHVIEMRYRPPGIITGLIITLIAFSLIFGLAVFPKPKSEGEGKTAESER